MSGFWDIVILMASTFVFVGYLFVLFHIVVDLFRDERLGGGSKVLWILALVFLPLLTSLVYVLLRGSGMSARSRQAVERAKAETDAYIRDVAKSPANEIAQAKSLLDSGAITEAEYAQLKARALAQAR